MKQKVLAACHFTRRDTRGWQRSYQKIDFFFRLTQIIHEICCLDANLFSHPRILKKKFRSQTKIWKLDRLN